MQVNNSGITLGISGWECTARTLDPLAYNKSNSAEFRDPILGLTVRREPLGS